MTNIVRILHLEDDSSDARLVREHLRKTGLESTITLVDTREAFQLGVDSGNFDLILADYNLPNFSGLEALEIVRRKYPSITFIFVSGAVGEERAVDLIRRGATDFVWKDRLGRLTPVIQRALAEANERLRREQAEAALRESESRFRLAQARGGIGVWEWDANSAVTYWSETMWSLYGLEPTGSGKKIQNLWLRSIHPDSRRALTKHIKEFLHSRQLEFRDEFRIVRPDGKVRWIETIAQLDRDEQGRPMHLLGVNIDVTARKTSELALRETDRRKDEFLAILAHELRNPLAPIKTALAVLRMRDDLKPDTLRMYELMERQVNNMVRLVDDLLEVSRITRGKIALRNELVDVKTVIQNAIETSRPLIDAAGHKLDISLPLDPLHVNGDSLRLSQVVSNLLNNSAKYGHAGGHIWLGVKQDGTNVVITVRDTGVGIPAEMLPNIFQMFTQIDRDHKCAQGGLGIGLSLVKSLVEMHGGSVVAESPGAGLGSTFTIQLPMASHGKSARAKRDRENQTAISRSSRILVVDDNQDAANSLGILLRLHGSDVEIVHDGIAALGAVRAFRPSVVLLDLGMPGVSGYEVAQQIRDVPQFDDITLVAVTGWAQDQDRTRTREAGFQHHLVKPVDPEALTALLDNIASKTTPQNVCSAPFRDDST